MAKTPWSGDRERDRGDRAGVVIRHKERVEKKVRKFQIIEGAS